MKTSASTRRQFVKGSAVAALGGAASTAGKVHAAPEIQSKLGRKTIKTDVLVCGGGCAGIAAALAAARSGAKTLLVEKAPFAGGIITSVGLPFFDGIASIKDNRVVVRGIALELLAKTGRCAPDATHIKPHNPTIPNTFEFKVLLDRELNALKPNLTVLFNSFACAAETSGDHITEVLLANKDGLVRVEPRVVIDCTGDGDVAAWSGAPMEQNEEVQPLTLHFRIARVKKTPDFSKHCREALVKAQERGELPSFYGPGIMFMYADDEIYIHGVRVPANPTDAADLTRAEMQGRADAMAMFQAWKKEVPGFENSYFLEAYPWIGVRESRRLLGQHVLTEDEIMKRQPFDDAIATGTWYVDLHPNKTTLSSANDFQPQKFQPEPYDIPYRSLVSPKAANLLVAGRCHSATRRAHASTRVTVTAMAMGEAAGTAAAMAMRGNAEVAGLEGAKVREILAAHGGGPFTHA